MGICFSKKKKKEQEQPCSATAPQNPPAPTKCLPHRPATGAKATPRPAQEQQAQAAASTVPGKKQIFVAVPTSKEKKTPLKGSDKQAAEKKKKSTPPEAATNYGNGVAGPQDEDSVTASTVRTSSCTKEEVESILIQCGRLSRNSSAVEDEYRRSRKRSYDFDCPERSVEEAREKQPQPNRGSPQRHRRTPGRERETGGEQKRSGSRERGGTAGNGGRRVSRSPARRSDSTAASSSSQPPSAVEKNRQPPGRLVSVPAREKPGIPSDAAGGTTAGGVKNKRGGGGEIRSASPRSRSPANPSRPGNENCHSLSRSSSRKAEHSPYRRNPMTEVDGNTVLRAEQPPPLKANRPAPDEKSRAHCIRKSEDGARKPAPPLQKSGDNLRRNAVVEVTNVVSSSGSTGGRQTKEEQQPASEGLAVERARIVLEGGDVAAGQEELPQHGIRAAVISRSRSSRRSSRDLDANPDGVRNQSSYASLLLEDIQHYHQQTAVAGAAAPAFSLPACLSKACSILEAVADLNSSCGGAGKFAETDQHHHSVKTGPALEELVEAREAAKDEDLMKPSLHKYGIELEPQESAGSNSFAGQTWVSSPCEPAHSVDSADRSWTSSWSNHKQQQQQSEKRGRNNNNNKTNQSQNGSAASSMGRHQQQRPERGDNGIGKVVSLE